VDRCRSSSDFFFVRLGFSAELDLDEILDVDLAFVRTVELVFSFLEDLPALASNSFRVSLTVSGAGSSLSFTPKRRPVEGPLGANLGAPGAYLGLGCEDVGLCSCACGTEGMGGPGFSAIITKSFTRAGAVFNTRFTLLTSDFSLGGKGGGDSLGGADLRLEE